MDGETVSEILRLRVASNDGGSITVPVLDRLLRSLAEAPTARVIVVEGVPGTFSRGLDLAAAVADTRENGPASIEGTLGLLQRLLGALRSAPQPVVALVDGEATGGGVGIAAAADVVLASPRASFSLPETLFGLVPGVIFPHLADRVGIGRARAMAFMGERVDASTAVAWGLADALSDDIGGAEAALLRRLLRQDSAAHATFKQLLGEYSSVDDDYRDTAIASFSALLTGSEAPKRIDRFMEGRKPWEGDP